MTKVFVTREIPEPAVSMLRDKGCEVEVSEKDGVLTKEELVAALQRTEYDVVLCLLTDTIDAEVFDAAPSVKMYANYAVGFNNIDVEEAKKRGIAVTNTPGVLTNTVAEHTFAMMLSIAARIVEADRFTREGRYDGWAPMMFLGTDVAGKTLGILGAGRIGSRVAHHARNGFDMNVVYYDVSRNEEFESAYGAEYYDTVDAVLERADFVTVHVPLLDSTRHLINAERLAKMKPSAYLVNTSRGPVIDEGALVEALRSGTIRGAALDVFEDEPALAEGLVDLANVIVTPHIASATEETRSKMAEIAAVNIVAFIDGEPLPNAVT